MMTTEESRIMYFLSEGIRLQVGSGGCYMHPEGFPSFTREVPCLAVMRLTDRHFITEQKAITLGGEPPGWHLTSVGRQWLDRYPGSFRF